MMAMAVAKADHFGPAFLRLAFPAAGALLALILARATQPRPASAKTGKPPQQTLPQVFWWYVAAAGGLRSLGAMTYGGLKSFLYAGVKKDDPRVQGAVKWIRAHYTLEENPGLKQAGLLLLSPHLRQGDGRTGRRPVRGRPGQEARLAARNCSTR